MATQTKGRASGRASVTYRPTMLGTGYEEADTMGVGIRPGGATQSTKDLVEGVGVGFGNPFEQIPRWIKGAFKKRKSR